MSRALCLAAFVAASFGCGANVALAQLSVPQYENFDDPTTGFELPGWTVDPASTEGVRWATDGTPSVVTAGGVPTNFSGANSLNINDGTDYFDTTDLALSQVAVSPYFDVTTEPNVYFGFLLAMDTEADFDILTVEAEDSVVGVFYSITVGGPGSAGTTYTLPDNTWWVISFGGSTAGLTNVRIRLTFDCDSSVNAFSGVFVDNFFAVCDDALPPTAATLVSPLSGATAADPITFTWTGSTDTSSCGAGEPMEYRLQIDDDPAFGSVNFNTYTGNTTYTATTGLPPGTWYWRITTYDQFFNSAVTATPATALESFFIEPEIAPNPPTLLFVNDDVNGAQSGNPGFVDPVLDLTPVFSALFTDSNTIANAVGLRFQVSDDPTFATLISDSGPVAISPVVPNGARCGDLTISIQLQRDTVYYWRIAFEDGSVTLPVDPISGLSGPFSIPQSFHTGDAFQFGVRDGSSHHGRRCWVATAAFGAESGTEVSALQTWRFGTMDKAAVGSLVSRGYHSIGASVSRNVPQSGVIAGPLGILSSLLGGLGGAIACCAMALLAVFAMGRWTSGD